MKILFRTVLLVGLIALLAPGVCPAAVATFDDLTLAPESYWNGDDDGTGYGTYSGFTSGDNYFVNYESAAPGWTYWDGFAYSNTTDTTTAGVDNQFSAITGGGVNGSSNYAVSYTLGMSGQPSQTYNGFTSGDYAQVVEGFYVTNTTYAYLSMRDGDGYSTAFGEDDWFKLTIYALDENYLQTGDYVDFYLAEGTDILSSWEWVDLSGLGTVHGLEFALSSSDGGSGYSMNTPGYFAMDNLTTSPVPVPAAVWLLGSGLIGLVGVRRKNC